MKKVKITKTNKKDFENIKKDQEYNSKKYQIQNFPVLE